MSNVVDTVIPLKTKIVLLGDGSVGKTSLKQKYMGLAFQERYLPTLGADIAIKKMTWQDILIQFHIWDLAGQPKFSAIRKNFYRGSAGAILVYDITQPDTLSNLKSWLEELHKYNNRPEIPLIIVGNKIDLRDRRRSTITTKQGLEFLENLREQFKKERALHFFESSAKTGYNVSKIFEKLAEDIFKKLKV